MSTSEVESIVGLQREAVAALLRSDALSTGDREQAFRQITETAARLLSVRRASVWRVDDSRTSIECLDLFDSVANTHEKGLVLTAQQAPRYFAALLEERCIAAHDAFEDLRTSEFRDSYLKPLGVTSLLDAPVLVRGKLIGIICHEHIGPMREWKAYEELVAGTLGDFVAMAWSASEHATQARELSAMHEGLERLVEARTSELLASQESVRALFETSPIGFVLTRIRDQTLVLGNERAAKLFEATLEEVKGQGAGNFWVHPEERTRVMTAAIQNGFCPEVDAELRTYKGRVFWASITATVLTFDGEKCMLVSVRDITEKKHTEEALRKSEETFRTLLEAAPTPLLVTGLEDAIVRFGNKRAADMFRITPDELVGKHAHAFYDDPDERQRFVDALRTDGRVDGFATRFKIPSGESFWALLNARTMMLNGEPVVAVGFSDLTEQKETEHRLRELASRDSLTGVYNRRYFFEAAEAALAISERHDKPSCVAMIDVDRFKKVNDRFGHDAGDAALQLLTRVCRKESRSSDVLARYGGEEFVLLLPEAGIAVARAVVERIRRTLSEEGIPAGDSTLNITVSVGLAERKPGEKLDVVLRRADEALYDAKHNGRNCVVLAHDEVRGRSSAPAPVLDGA